MRKWFLCLLAIGALIASGALLYSPGTVVADDGGWGGIVAKHQHEMGGPHECFDCHSEEGVADEPPVLKGRYAHMGGLNHECTDCHDGVKAPVLELLPEEYGSCADCHPTKKEK
ncbi:MAG: hypothetical protein GTO24_20415 [candidate division Zixibacteria bacterium]|nr:hypothetical protein [candidate division Zixibacteria bacterium]